MFKIVKKLREREKHTKYENIIMYSSKNFT